VKDDRVELSGQIDIDVPNVARAYDYLLGGAHNFAADRQLAALAEKNLPGIRDTVRLNRTFLRRVVRFMIGSGVRQFLDIGSGIPTVGNVHEVAQEIEPSCRVVYVDKDRMAVAHSQLLLDGNERTAAVQADLREPEDVLGRRETRRLLNFDEPVGLLMLLVWHFIPDSDDPPGLLARYRDALAPGSFLAITHISREDDTEGLRTMVQEVRRIGDDATPRSHEQIVPLFEGFELIEPGITTCAAWRPDGPGDFSERLDAQRLVLAGVGRKPADR
jgi:SAM-dependent methyltransferase